MNSLAGGSLAFTAPLSAMTHHAYCFSQLVLNNNIHTVNCRIQDHKTQEKKHPYMLEFSNHANEGFLTPDDSFCMSILACYCGRLVKTGDFHPHQQNTPVRFGQPCHSRHCIFGLQHWYSIFTSIHIHLTTQNSLSIMIKCFC